MANFQDALDRAFPSDKPAASPSGSANSNVSAFVRDVGPIAERVGAEIGVDPSILIGQWGLETRWGKSVIPGTNNYGNIKDFRGSGVTARDNMNGSVDKYRAFKTGEEFADHFVGLLTRKYGNALNSGDDALAYGAALRRNGYAEDPNYAAKIASAADMVRKAGGKGQASIYAPRGEFIGQTEKVIRDSKKQQEIADEGVGTAFAKGFGDATDQIPELAVGAGTALADVFGLDELRDAGLGYLQKNKEQAQDEARSYASFTDSLENGDMGRWAAYALGYGVNQLAQAAITGGIGATVGKVGLVGLLKGTAERVTAEALAKGAAQEVAAKAGMEAAELAAKKYGAAFAMYGNTYGQELGSIYPDAVEQSQKTGNPVDLAKVFGSAGVAAALEAAPEIGIAGKLIDGAGKGSKRMLGRAAGTIPKQIGLEGGTEYAQTGVEQWGAQRPLDTPEARKERIDSAAMGAIMGGPAGAIEAVPAPRAEAVPDAGVTQAAPPAPKPNSPLSNAAAMGAHINSVAMQQQVLAEQEQLAQTQTAAPQDAMAAQNAAVQRQVMASQKQAAPTSTDYAAAEQAENEIGGSVGIEEQERILEFNRLLAEEQASLAERRGDIASAQRIRAAEQASREAIRAARPRNSVGAPSGSFGQMNEFADFVKEEGDDVAARRNQVAERQAQAKEIEAARAQSELESADARVQAQMERESVQRRRTILDAILADPETANPAARLSAELNRQGFRDTSPTADELATIQRFEDIKAAQAEPDVIPSAPNEMDAYVSPRAPQNVTVPSQQSEAKPKQAPARKLTPLEIRNYIKAGAVLNGDVLTLPDGTTIKLRGPQIAAAREAVRNVRSDAEVASKSGYAPPKSVDAVPDSWQQVWRNGATPNQEILIESVQRALDAGNYYNKDVEAFVADDLGVSNESLQVGRDRVDGGAFGYDVYHARREIERREGFKANVDAANKLDLEPGKQLGTLVFNDAKQTKAVQVESISDDKQSVVLVGSRGKNKVKIDVAPVSVMRAIQRAEERGARKESSQQDESQQVESQAATSENFDVSARTDDQLRAADSAAEERTVIDERKSDAFYGFLEGKAPNTKELIRKALEKTYRFDGAVMTVREHIDSLHEAGALEVGSFEEPKIKPMSRMQFFRASQREQDAHDKKMREAGTKTVYTVSGYELGKYAHDYAKHLLDRDASADAKPEIRSDIDAAAHEAATSPLNDTPQPTDGQKSAGNYKVGRVRVHGMDISIENPQGSVRSGTSPDGKKWESTLANHYGYFTGTKAADGDHLDVFLTDGAEDAPVIWIIDQKNKDGSFDEHKTVLGPRTEEEARAAYLANYEPGWDGLGAISSMPIEAFKAWAFDGKKKRKPLVYVEPEVTANHSIDATLPIVRYENKSLIVRDGAGMEIPDYEGFATNRFGDRVGTYFDGGKRKSVDLLGKSEQAKQDFPTLMREVKSDSDQHFSNLATLQNTPFPLDRDWHIKSRPAINAAVIVPSKVGESFTEADFAEVKKYAESHGMTAIASEKLGSIRVIGPWIDPLLHLDAFFSDGKSTTFDPREAYADEKERAYIAKRGGVVPPKAAMAVRIGAYREYDRNQAAQDKQSEWVSLDEYVKSNPNVRETRARNAWASDISDAITEGKDVPPTIVDELLEKMPGFAPDAIASRDVLMDRYKQAIDTDIERAIERLREEHANLAKKLDHKRVKTSHEKYVEVRDQLISLNDRIHALEQERRDRARGDFTTETAAEDYLVRRLVQLSGVSEEDAKTRIVRATVSAQPTHQDPGQPSEPVTPTVVAKSIQKSARNTEFNPAEAKKWLIGEIDKAVANVPAENAELAAELAREKAKTFDVQGGSSAEQKEFYAMRDSNVAKIVQQIGFVTFDVPGDGKFKVVNAVEKLQEFRKKVEASPGFKEPAKKPPVPSRDVVQGSYTPRDAILEGDYLNAYELAKAQGKPLVFSVSANDEPSVYTDSATADGVIDGLAFIVARQAVKDGKWYVIDPSTGLLVNKNGMPTKAAALTAATAKVKGHEDKLRALIADPAKAMPQSSLEAAWLKWAEEKEGRSLDEEQDAEAENLASENPEPSPIGLTPKQFHEARMKWVAQEYGLSDAEVRQDYDTDAAKKSDDDLWVSAVRQAFKDGTELTRSTLDKLEELRPGAFMSNLHDYPEAKIPAGYQLPAARKAEKEAADAKRESKKQIAASFAEDRAKREELTPSDLTNIFAGLSSRGLAKTRAQKAAQAHPRAEQIAYVQDNFIDILSELEDAGLVKINCD